MFYISSYAVRAANITSSWIKTRNHYTIEVMLRLIWIITPNRAKIKYCGYVVYVIWRCQYNIEIGKNKKSLYESLNWSCVLYVNSVTSDGVSVAIITSNWVKTRNYCIKVVSLPDHRTEFLYDLLPVLLYSDSGGVTRWMGVHRTHHCGYWWFLVVAGGRMCHVRTKEYHGFVKYLLMVKREREIYKSD